MSVIEIFRQSLGFQNTRRFAARDKRVVLIHFAHNGYQGISRFYTHGKLPSRCEIANVVLSRMVIDERLFIDACVEFAVDAICVINLSNIAAVHGFWAGRTRYSCLRDGPRTAPAPLDHAGYYSKQVLDENVDKPAAHMGKKRSRCTDIRETRKGQFLLTDEMRRPVSGRDAVYAPKLSTCSKHR